MSCGRRRTNAPNRTQASLMIHLRVGANPTGSAKSNYKGGEDMGKLILGLMMTFIMYGMCIDISELVKAKRAKARLIRMRDRYYGLYHNARTEYDREYFYSVFSDCEEKLKAM